MKHKTIIIFFLIFLFQYLHSRSVVYNFRIAQVTGENVFDVNTPRKKYTFITLLFDEISKKRYDDIHLNFFGGLATFIYNHKAYFSRFDFAVSNIQEKAFKNRSSRTQTDDFLITLGKNLKITKDVHGSISGLFGFPTHAITALQGPDFGYGQYGLGAQIDGSYQFNRVNSFLLGSRYVHFFPRSALNNYKEKFKFGVGNVIDILIASKNIWGTQGFEVGYTTRFSFGAEISPYYHEIIEKTNYIRSSWYGVYQYRFMLRNTINRFLLNIACGFDHVPHRFGNQYTVFLWAAWDIKF